MDLEIIVYKSLKDSAPQIQAVKEKLLPRYPHYFLLIGKSGSGKTMCLLNLLLNKDMFKDYYHEIIYFSPTGKSDSLVKKLGLKSENKITDKSTKRYYRRKGRRVGV